MYGSVEFTRHAQVKRTFSRIQTNSLSEHGSVRHACVAIKRLEMAQLSSKTRVRFLFFSLMRVTHKRWHHVGSAWVLLLSSHNLAAAIFARRRVRAHVKPTFTFIAALIPRRTKPSGDAAPLLNHPCNKTVRSEWHDAVVRVRAKTKKQMHIKKRKKEKRRANDTINIYRTSVHNVSFTSKCKDLVEGRGSARAQQTLMHRLKSIVTAHVHSKINK